MLTGARRWAARRYDQCTLTIYASSMIANEEILCGQAGQLCFDYYTIQNGRRFSSHVNIGPPAQDSSLRYTVIGFGSSKLLAMVELEHELISGKIQIPRGGLQMVKARFDVQRATSGTPIYGRRQTKTNFMGQPSVNGRREFPRQS